MKLKKILGLTALAAIATFALAACGSSKSSSKDGETTVKVGVMTLSDTEKARWDQVQKNLDDAKTGIKLEFTQFTDYSQPNVAVKDGSVDINAFQHYNFLDNWNSKNDNALVAVADTYIAPIRLYSGTENGKNKYTSIKEIPKGGTIAVPNDPTNESRALYVLQSAGLIKLDTKDGQLANVSNIKENPKDLKQWYNVIAAKKDWEKSDKAKAIKEIIKAYHKDNVKKVIEESSEGMDQPVF